MRAFLEKVEGDYLDDFVYITKYQFLNRGIEVVDFDGTDLENLTRKNPTNKDICIGSVQACNKFFDLIEVERPKYLGYPEELLGYCNRKIWSSKFSDITEFPVFIKPKDEVKLFTGMVIESKKDYDFVSTYYPEITPDLDVLCSGVLNFVSEYRCFVHKGELQGIHWYNGDFKITLNDYCIETIEGMIEDYESSPIAYTLDVGLYESDNMYLLALVEVNDMWAIGSYGMDAKKYTRMSIDRFQEIKGL